MYADEQYFKVDCKTCISYESFSVPLDKYKETYLVREKKGGVTLFEY